MALEKEYECSLFPFSSILVPFSLSCSQAELEELVKKEHARIDSQDSKEKTAESKGAEAKPGSASATPQTDKEE